MKSIFEYLESLVDEVKIFKIFDHNVYITLVSILIFSRIWLLSKTILYINLRIRVLRVTST